MRNVRVHGEHLSETGLLTAYTIFLFFCNEQLPFLSETIASCNNEYFYFYWSERTIFGPPPTPINFVHDHLFFSKIIIVYFIIIYFRIRLGLDLFWAKRCGYKDWGGGIATARTG